MIKPAILIKQLYDEDHLLWLQQTAEQLKERNLDNLDWEHLIEEIEDLGRAEKNKAKSYLRQLLIHLLIYQYWQTERSLSGRGWLVEIDNFRYELNLSLQSKTLYNFIAQELDSTYQSARKNASKKSGLAPDSFPSVCPFNLEDLLNDDFLPVESPTKSS